MSSLITTYGLGVIIVILIIAIPSIIASIGWCKSIWSKRTQFIKDNKAEGRRELQEEEKEENRFLAGEERIKKLEEIVAKLTDIQANQQEAINELVDSNKLTIKTYIKEQHTLWTEKGYIDSQVLEILEDRFKIYTKEGGNSWALKLMNEMRALPLQKK